MTTGIYAITNLVNGKIYVGQAANVEKRWRDHKCALTGGYHYNRHLMRAWNKYGADAFVFSVIELCPVDDLDEREMYFIALHRSQGLCYNMTSGGEGTRGLVHTAEHRARNSASKKGNQNRLGHTPTDEARAKIGEANRNRAPISDETRAKQSAAAQNRAPISEETRAKKSAANKGNQNALGHTHTDEAKAKMSASGMGNQNMLGHTDSDETRAKKSESQKATWAARKAAKDNDLP